MDTYQDPPEPLAAEMVNIRTAIVTLITDYEGAVPPYLVPLVDALVRLTKEAMEWEARRMSDWPPFLPTGPLEFPWADRWAHHPPE